MLKKIKFNVFNIFLTIFLVLATYFIIVALLADRDRINLAPLFATVCFVLAFLLLGIRLIIRFIFKDLKKIEIAEVVLLTIVSLIFFYFCAIILGLMGVI